MLLNSKILIIAEIGVNHNGKMSAAKKLINEAKKAGADYAKFQMYLPNEIATKFSKKTKYQEKSMGKKISQHELLQQYYLNFKKIKLLAKYCKKKRIKFLASVFDVKSLNLLNKLNVDFIKLPSSEIDNYFLLEALTKQNKKVIFSTGMSSLIEVNRTYSFLNKRKKLAIPMYCVSSYPTSLNEIDIENLKTIKKKYKLIGFSDHTLSNESSILASYFGCKFIEKHITLNKKNTGPDHSSSLNPKEFRSFVQNIRNVELILKKPKKKLEIENKILVRKYLVASKKIKIGEIFSKNNITAKRCGGGIETFKFNKIFKKRSKYNFKPDQPLKF